MHIHSSAQANDFGITAIVNDSVITDYDVMQRIRFIMATTGLEPSREMAANLAPRAVDALIDEELQIQQAKQSSFTAEPTEITDAIAIIERESGKPEGSLLKFLDANNIARSTLEHQIRAQILWAKYVQQRIAPRVRISESEIERVAAQRASSQEAVEEVKLSSIILPVGQSDDASTKQLADSIYADLARGISFQDVARQISSGTNMASTSPVWVPVQELDPKLADRIRGISPPSVTKPLRIPAGYQIVLVQDQRVVDYRNNAEVLFKEIVLGLSPNATEAEIDVLMTIAREIRKNPGSCGSKDIAGATALDDLDFEVHYTRTTLGALSPQILPLVRSLTVNNISEPFATPDSIRLLKLCERVQMPVNKIDTTPIRRQLQEEQFEIEVMRTMREARDNAYIDIRR